MTFVSRTLLALLVAALLATCAPREASDPVAQEPLPPATMSPATGGTLLVAASSDLGGFNELLSGAGSFTQSVLQLMFLQLFAEQPDFHDHPPTFEPELAQSWEWSEDGTILTLHLRSDVVWSNGEPVTADDVEWTWRAQTHPAVAWGHAESKENIATVEAVDRHTVRVTYHRPGISQLADLNEGVILPRSAWSQLPFDSWRQNAGWFEENLVTNGPFRLESWDRQQQLALRRFDRYYRPGRPRLDRIVFRIVPQKTGQVGHLLAGEAHFVDQLPAADADRIAARPDLEVLSFWARQYNFICWNTARPPFEESEVRRALTLAIDRQALIDALWFGHARVANSPIPSSVWAHDSDIETWPYDPSAARDILLRHGWSDSDGDGTLDRDGAPFSFELLTNSNSDVRVDAAVMIQDQLRRIGIRAEVRRLEFNTLIELSLAHDFDAVLGGWTIDTSLDLDYAFHSEAIDSGYNFGSFSDPIVDQLLDQLDDLSSAEEQGEKLLEIQARLHLLQPYTFLWEPQRLTGISRRLRDARPNALDPFFAVEDWWLEPKP